MEETGCGARPCDRRRRVGREGEGGPALGIQLAYREELSKERAREGPSGEESG